MQNLIGMALPNAILRSSGATDFNPSLYTSRTVYFCYPFTGRPDKPNPPNWDNIKGAHGSTPQALNFANYHEEFKALRVAVFGLSFLSEEWIADFAVRNHLPYLLLSDANKYFSRKLNLPSFRAGDQDYLERLTFICNSGRIQQVIHPVSEPEKNAEVVLDILRCS